LIWVRRKESGPKDVANKTPAIALLPPAST